MEKFKKLINNICEMYNNKKYDTGAFDRGVSINLNDERANSIEVRVVGHGEVGSSAFKGFKESLVGKEVIEIKKGISIKSIDGQDYFDNSKPLYIVNHYTPCTFFYIPFKEECPNGGEDSLPGKIVKLEINIMPLEIEGSGEAQYCFGE